MKRITSFVFAVIYLAFTTGTLWTAGEDRSEFNSHPATFSEGKKNAISSVSEVDLVHFAKGSKHLTHGKVKTPRPSYTSGSTQLFIASLSYDYHAENTLSITDNPHPVAIYLRNGVLRL